VNLDADQLEWVVREVVRRLREHALPFGGASVGRGETSPTADAHITLTESLITTATLEHRLEGVTQLRVSARAVVTPSVRDLLKERNIELVRGA
jgi:hypothetical protein